MKKILALLLAAMMVVSMAACGNNETPAGTTAAGTTPVETTPAEQAFVDNYAKFQAIEDNFERSAAIYEQVLGEFNETYAKAKEAKSVSERYALMAIAEAKMLSAGIFLPTTSKGGNYAMTKVAPYTNTPVLWGNDTYRYHDRIVVDKPIEKAHVTEMKAKWTELLGTGEYEAFVKNYLKEKDIERYRSLIQRLGLRK